MTAEHHCTECSLSRFIKNGESFTHRYGMNAINYGTPFLLRRCTTKEEKSYSIEPECDRPHEFVANEEKIG